MASSPPRLGVYPLENIRTMARLQQASAHLMKFQQGSSVPALEIVGGAVQGQGQVFTRLRSFVFTLTYLCTHLQSSFTPQDAFSVGEKVWGG